MVSNASNLSRTELETGSVLSPSFNADGLITAVVQDADNGDVLMLAHMNEEALHKTLQSRKAHFWSRSRQKLWQKGETSGNVLEISEIRIDCDQDAVVLKATLAGDAACHTGARSCFFRSVRVADGKAFLSKTEPD